jgi:hypothetical protein
LLVDDAAHVRATTAVACAVDHSVSDGSTGSMHGGGVGLLDRTGQLHEARKHATEL